jgi:hypothetical protein
MFKKQIRISAEKFRSSQQNTLKQNEFKALNY